METPKQIQVVIISNLSIFRQGLTSIIQDHPRLKICGSFCDVPSSLDCVKDSDPDIVLLDIKVLDECYADVLKEIVESSPRTRVIAISCEKVTYDILKLIKAGIKSVIPCHADASEICRIIECVQQGEFVINADFALSLIEGLEQLSGQLKTNEKSCEFGLTKRELEILHLLRKGYKNIEIAYALYISKNTVRVHLSHILEKMNVKTRLQAATYHLEHREEINLSGKTQSNKNR